MAWPSQDFAEMQGLRIVRGVGRDGQYEKTNPICPRLPCLCEGVFRDWAHRVFFVTASQMAWRLIRAILRYSSTTPLKRASAIFGVSLLFAVQESSTSLSSTLAPVSMARLSGFVVPGAKP